MVHQKSDTITKQYSLTELHPSCSVAADTESSKDR
jgi:hypothetical protein